jgi:oligopeptide/dipeptide ABC transporter ATP-binding protein
VIDHPRHPYTRGLIAASRLQRGADGRFGALRGEVPTVDAQPGCPFAPRCGDVRGICRERMPDDTTLTATHHVKCWDVSVHDAFA